MIGSLRGTLLNKTPGQVLVDVQGIGYEVSVTLSAYDRLPSAGQETQLYVVESMAMYGGGGVTPLWRTSPRQFPDGRSFR